MITQQDIGAMGQAVTTTDSTWTDLLSWSVANGSGHHPGSGYGRVMVICRNPSTGESAYWDQPLGVKCGSSEAMPTGEPPMPCESQKEPGLMLTGIDIAFVDENIVIRGKGVNDVTLSWLASIKFDLFQADDS